MTKARLTDKIALNMLIERLTKERDEALTELATAQKDLTCGQHEEYKMVWCNRCIEDERGQARASTQEKHIGRPFQEVDLEEMVRLRAEVERLRSEEECPACGPLERERDEALKEIERLRAVVKTTKIFAAKFATLQPVINDIFAFRHVHGVGYSGENYSEEWLALQKVLAAWEEGK